MGQGSVLQFLKRYQKSKKYKKKRWLSVKEIHNAIKDSKDGSGIGSVTCSIKKLRDSNSILFIEKSVKGSSRKILHYSAK